MLDFSNLSNMMKKKIIKLLEQAGYSISLRKIIMITFA